MCVVVKRIKKGSTTSVLLLLFFIIKNIKCKILILNELYVQMTHINIDLEETERAGGPFKKGNQKPYYTSTVVVVK